MADNGTNLVMRFGYAGIDCELTFYTNGWAEALTLVRGVAKAIGGNGEQAEPIPLPGMPEPIASVEVPNCKIHGTPMYPSQFEDCLWHCPQWLAPGKRCTYKIRPDNYVHAA